MGEVAISTLEASAALNHEATLLDRVSAHPETRELWFWQSPQALVAPRKLATKSPFQAAAAEMAKAGWPVAVRGTGGDVTPQGPGIVNVTHAYARPPGERFDLNREYDRLCRPIEVALGRGASRGWMPGAFCDGAHNVQFDGKKFAGTAMRFRPARAERTRYAVMAHAILLFEVPQSGAIAAINRFLSLLGEERVIERSAHTGLPEGLSGAAFVDRLVVEFARV